MWKMDFIDYEADESNDESVLAESSQPVADGCRPHKRRRLNSSDAVEDENTQDYDLPPNVHVADDDAADVDEFAQYKSKYEDRMHVPEYAETQKDTFVTQPDQPWSSPSRMRGPRWRKPGTPPQLPEVPAVVPQPRPRPPSWTSPTHAFIGLQPPPVAAEYEFDGDDADLLEAFMSSPATLADMGVQETFNALQQGFTENATQSRRPQPQSFRQTTLFGNTAAVRIPNSTQIIRGQHWRPADHNEPPTHHDINKEAMATVVYPTNVGRVRDYQYAIIMIALFNNTLVALPTGLG